MVLDLFGDFAGVSSRSSRATAAGSRDFGSKAASEASAEARTGRESVAPSSARTAWHRAQPTMCSFHGFISSGRSERSWYAASTSDSGQCKFPAGTRRPPTRYPLKTASNFLSSSAAIPLSLLVRTDLRASLASPAQPSGGGHLEAPGCGGMASSSCEKSKDHASVAYSKQSWIWASSRPGCRGAPDCACGPSFATRSEEHTSELQSRFDLVCRLLLEKKKKKNT